MQINKYKNLGSGWHLDNQRHSNAKRFGIAGGLYAKKKSKTPRYDVRLTGMPVYQIEAEGGDIVFWSLMKPDEGSGEKIIKRKKMTESFFYSMELSDTDEEFFLKELELITGKKHKKGLYYAISSISDKGKTDDIISQVRSKLSSEGIKADIYNDKGQIRLKNIRMEKSINVRDAEYTKSGIRKTNALSWDDWVKVNDSVNDVLDKNDINATVSSLGGKFKIRNKSTGRFSEDDWERNTLWNDSIRRGEN